ncbi:MAG: hypothetical protein AB1714_11515 [Acidobacteriota bacterium]
MPELKRLGGVSVRHTTVMVACVHVLLATVIASKFDWHVSGFIRINRASAALNADRMTDGLVVLTQSTGFDGKENYFVAVDPFPGPEYAVPYRLKRILYPLLSHVLALGRRDLLPLTMLVINLIAVTAGTCAIAATLQLLRRPPAFAIVYGLSIAEIVGVKYSLTTPLSLSLACAGIYLFYRKRPVFSAACFSLSLLSNEYTLVIPLGLAIASLARREWKTALILAASPLPWAAYLLFVAVHYSARAVTDAAEVFAAPFQGILDVIRHLNPALPWRQFVYHDVAPLLFVGVVAVITITQLLKLRKGLAVCPLLILYYVVFALFLKEDCWRIINISRYLSPVFPLLLLSLDDEPGSWDLLSVSTAGAFSLVSIAGILVEPRVPFLLWHG